MAGGGGLTLKCLRHLEPAGIDVYTSGDHVWDQRVFEQELPQVSNVLRPANVSPEQPGRGYDVFTSPGGVPVAVVSLLGRTFMNAGADCPFRAASLIVQQVRPKARVIVVDFHAEATSEKCALGRFLDGQVSAVLGTHTHVATADEKVLPRGTAYQTDVGMVGAAESILGRAIEPVLRRFSTGMPSRFDVVETGIVMHATVLDIDDKTGLAMHIERLRIPDAHGGATGMGSKQGRDGV